MNAEEMRYAQVTASGGPVEQPDTVRVAHGCVNPVVFLTTKVHAEPTAQQKSQE